MKYVIILGDGMSDEPLKELGDKTPLELAETFTLDELAKKSEIGIAYTIPYGMKPGSDTANLSVLGYNPEKYYTGRSPLEALSIGVDLEDSDIAIRCNFVTLSDEDNFDDKTMIDHSSGEISTEEAKELINLIISEFNNDIYQFYLGTSYRHLLIWNKGEVLDLSQPHDILGENISEYLPSDEKLNKMIRRSYELLNNHPINIRRQEKGLNKANSIWFWGAGTKPQLDDFFEKTGKRGAMISAVDLLKGIAIGSGMKVIEVEGANGTLHTNYEGKALAAVNALKNDECDFIYIHVEAPDEMGHQGNVDNKIKAIEYLDKRLIKVFTEEMEKSNIEYRMLIMPDHPTPIWCRTHTSDPVPYLLYDTTKNEEHSWSYNEKEAIASDNVVSDGYTIISKLIEQN